MRWCVLILYVLLAGCARAPQPLLPDAPAIFPVTIGEYGVGKPLSVRLEKAPKRYKVSGLLPPGLTIASKQGYLWLIGVPKRVGVYKFQIVQG